MSPTLKGTRWLGFACTAALLSSTWGHAADETHSQDAVQAAYLYRFVGFVEWPEESMANHPFTIAISGAPGLARELRRLLPAHPIHGEIAQVREVTRVQELGGAQMLYIGTGHVDFLRAFEAHGNQSILVVTADEQGIEMGSVLNFVIVDKRVRFEVSLTAAERAGLKISSELLSVAIRVRGGRRQSDYFCIPFARPDESDSLCGVRQADRHSGAGNFSSEKEIIAVSDVATRGFTDHRSARRSLQVATRLLIQESPGTVTGFIDNSTVGTSAASRAMF
jgi:hypothetical protein